MQANQLQEGALCQLKIGRWDASIRMSKDKLGKSVPKEIVRAMQDLVEDKTLLKDLTTVRRATKNLLVNNSLPFPVDGVFWVPKEKIPELDTAFEEAKQEYFRRRDILKRRLPLMKRRFSQKYPKFYNPDVYPKSFELDKKYYFTWNFFHFTIPDEKTEVLSPAMYKREQAKFQSMVKEMEEMTVNLIGNELFKRIKTLQEQCENDNINAGTVNSIERFMDKWRSLWEGHVDNTRLKGIMKSLRVQMARTTAEKLKDSEDFRNKAAAKLEKLVGRIQNVPNLELKRKLDV